MKKLTYLLLLFLFFPLAVFATHSCSICYIAPGGSDAADGTAKTSGGGHGPWLHVPEMTSATGLAASQVPAPDDQYILEGGGVWHFGDLGTATNTGGTWFWSSDGTSGHNIYIGVDPTWFLAITGTVNTSASGNTVTWQTGIRSNGDFGILTPGETITINSVTYTIATVTDKKSATLTTSPGNQTGVSFSYSYWTRPIMTADNALTPNPKVWGDYVASCAHQVGSNNAMFWLSNNGYVTIDNLEWTGLCQNDVEPIPFAHDLYWLAISTIGNGDLYEHNYFHGWTHTQFSCTGQPPVGTCYNMTVILGGHDSPDVWLQNIVDGADSDPGGTESAYGGGWEYIQSVFRYVVGPGANTNAHVLRDTLFEYIGEPSDLDGHGNVWQEPGSDKLFPVHAYYNNLFRHICVDQANNSICPAGVDLFDWENCFGPGDSIPTCTQAQTSYYFDNVVYDAQKVEYIAVGNNDGDNGTFVIFNNSLQYASAAAQIRCVDVHSGLKFKLFIGNNHYTYDGANPIDQADCPAGTQAGSPFTELLETNPNASGLGFFNTAGGLPSYSVTSYTNFSGGSSSTSEASARQSAPQTATVQNLSVNLTPDTSCNCSSLPLGTGNSAVFTLRVNGSSTAITCTISGSSATTCVDNTHTINVTSGDLIDWQIAPSGTITVTPDVEIRSSFSWGSGGNGLGYTPTNGYAPTSISSPTVGVGTNKNSTFCAQIAAAAVSDPLLTDAITACGQDTRYACIYSELSNTVTCPDRTPVTRPTSAAWDIGAYQVLSGGGGNIPAPTTKMF